MSDTNRSVITLRLDGAELRRMKIAAAYCGISLNQWAVECLIYEAQKYPFDPKLAKEHGAKRKAARKQEDPTGKVQ